MHVTSCQNECAVPHACEGGKRMSVELLLIHMRIGVAGCGIERSVTL